MNILERIIKFVKLEGKCDLKNCSGDQSIVEVSVRFRIH